MSRRTGLAIVGVLALVIGAAGGLVAQAATTTTSGSFTLGCKVTTAGAVTCSGTLPSASPTTTTTTAAPVTTTTLPPTTTTAPPAQTNCVTGNAITGPYFDPNIYFSNGNGTTTYVKNQNTGANAGTTETLCNPTTSAENWTVAANMKGGTSVQYFPDMQEVLTTAVVNPTGQGQLVSGFSSLSSTFNTTSPPDANGNWESAYDLWFDNRAGDVMIWENTSTARGTGGAYVINSNVSIAGQSFTLLENCGSTCQPTSDEVMLVRNANAPSGTENLLADIQYLQGAGYVPAATGISEANFGWEICGTAGTTENFALNGYTLTKS